MKIETITIYASHFDSQSLHEEYTVPVRPVFEITEHCIRIVKDVDFLIQ